MPGIASGHVRGSSCNCVRADKLVQGRFKSTRFCCTRCMLACAGLSSHRKQGSRGSH